MISSLTRLRNTEDKGTFFVIIRYTELKEATSESRYSVGKQCKVAIQQRTIKPRNSPDRETLRLIAFLDQGDVLQ
ncbi:MAG: hypothetical protein COA78_12865 [Blastopirellula sp.]|nr:MAG: hypothetical protein COA78_12865 [Blastopirellula sp.]